jgi:hypothetical protein
MGFLDWAILLSPFGAMVVGSLVFIGCKLGDIAEEIRRFRERAS